MSASVDRRRALPVRHPACAVKENACFRTPWHWYIHGLGLGQGVSPYDPVSAECLLQAGRALSDVSDSPLHGFTFKLLCQILAQGEKITKGVSVGKSPAGSVAGIALFQPGKNPAHYIKMSALFVSCLVRGGMLEEYLPNARRHLALAFTIAEQLPERDDRTRYEKLQLMSSLFMAATHVQGTRLICGQGRGEASYLQSALQLTSRIENRFLKGRGAAVMLAAIGLTGLSEHVQPDIEALLIEVLTDLDHQIQDPQTYRDDGVHSGLDYLMFPLSLILNALPALGLERFTRFRRNWLDTAVDIFDRLSPDSRASQALFLVSALDSVDKLAVYFPNAEELVTQCVDDYLGNTNGLRPDDYLRCTYLIHLAAQLGVVEALNPQIPDMLSSAMVRSLQRKDEDGGVGNKYQSDTMLAAYSLSAFARLGKLETLFGDNALLPQLIGRLVSDSDEFRCDSPKLCFALVDAALRMAPDSHSKIQHKAELSEMIV